MSDKAIKSPAMNAASPIQMVMGAVEVAQKRLAEQSAQPVGNMIGEFPAMNAASPTDSDLCALEYAVNSLRAIAERSEVVGGVIEPMSDIRAASRRARAALTRLEPVAQRAGRAAPVGQGSATSGEAVATWQERMGPGYIDGGADLPEESAMKAEIADLRAALAAKAEQSNTPVPRVGGNTCEAMVPSLMRGPSGAAPVAERAAAPASVPVGEVTIHATGTPDEYVCTNLFRPVPHGTKLYLAAPEVAPASVPEGYKLVPADPTKGMIRRAWLYGNYASGDAPDPVYAYKAMLAAAPEVAQPAAQGERAAPSESIDTPEFRHLLALCGYDIRNADKWDKVIAYVHAWGAKRAPGSAEWNGWRVVAEDDFIDTTRALDVVLDNGVMLNGKNYSQIDWTAARDWRYSDLATPAPTAGEPNAEDAVEVAEAVAAEVLHHIDRMYPAMWAAVAKTARMSIRNTIRVQSKRYLAAISTHIKATQGDRDA